MPNRDKEEVLKALAAELGYILHPKSRTLCIFGGEYIFAKVRLGQHFNSDQLLLFTEATSEREAARFSMGTQPSAQTQQDRGKKPPS